MKFLFSFFPILCFSLNSLGQLPKELFFNHLSADNGLSQATNVFVYKDSRGFVWSSSIAGLNRFDGKEIKIYQPNPSEKNSMKGNNIQSPFYEDAEGNIWFSTYEAVNCYMRKKDHFISFAIYDSLSGEPLPAYYLSGIDNDNRLWVIAQHKDLYHFDIVKKDGFKYVHTLCQDVHRGSFQFDSNGQVVRFITHNFSGTKPGIQITTYQSLDFTEYKQVFLFEEEGIHVMNFYAEQDTIWLATRVGLIKLNINNESWENHNMLHEKRIRWVTAVRPFNNRYFVIGSTCCGMLFFDKWKRAFVRQVVTVLNAPYTIKKNDVGNVYVDKDNGFWLMLNFMGMDYAYPTKTKFDNYYTRKKGYADGGAVMWNSMAMDHKERVWVGSFSKGVFIFDNEKNIVSKITTKTHSELPSNKILKIFKDRDDRMWILTWGGIALYDKNISKLTQLTTSENIFLHIDQSNNGDIFLSSYSKGGIWKAETDSNNDVMLRRISKIDTSKACPFIYAGKDNILYVCEESVRLRRYDIESDYKALSTLPVGGDIKCIYEKPQDSLLWIATTYGLVKYNKDENTVYYYTQKEGLPNSTVYAIVPDANGRFWLTTNKGVIQFDPVEEKSVSYGIRDGVSALEFNQYSYIQKTRRRNLVWLNKRNHHLLSRQHSVSLATACNTDHGNKDQ